MMHLRHLESRSYEFPRNYIRTSVIRLADNQSSAFLAGIGVFIRIALPEHVSLAYAQRGKRHGLQTYRTSGMWHILRAYLSGSSIRRYSEAFVPFLLISSELRFVVKRHRLIKIRQQPLSLFANTKAILVTATRTRNGYPGRGCGMPFTPALTAEPPLVGPRAYIIVRETPRCWCFANHASFICHISSPLSFTERTKDNSGASSANHNNVNISIRQYVIGAPSVNEA